MMIVSDDEAVLDESVAKLYIERANGHMRKHVEQFRLHLKRDAAVDAENDIAEATRSLDITVASGFMEHVKLPETLYDRLETTPEQMRAELTPELFQRGVDHYLQRAAAESLWGHPESVAQLCDNAAYCAQKGYGAKERPQVENRIGRVKEQATAFAATIGQDVKTVRRFGFRRANSPESFRVAELGYDPYIKPTAKDHAEIGSARRRLEYLGFQIWCPETLSDAYNVAWPPQERRMSEGMALLQSWSRP